MSLSVVVMFTSYPLHSCILSIILLPIDEFVWNPPPIIEFFNVVSLWDDDIVFVSADMVEGVVDDVVMNFAQKKTNIGIGNRW